MMFSFCSANHKQNHNSKQMKSESHFYSEVFTSSNYNVKPESIIRKKKQKTTLDKEEEKKVLPEIDFGKKFNLFRNMKNDFVRLKI